MNLDQSQTPKDADVAEVSDSGAPPPASALQRGIVRWVGTSFLLAATAYFVDLDEVWHRLQDLDGRWLGAAILITIPMHIMLAIRWWFTARQIDVPLRFTDALGEYYLSTFLNQILPLGVAGDAARALRHRSRLSDGVTNGKIGPPVRALLIERLSGQAVLIPSIIVASTVWYFRGSPEVALLGWIAAAAMTIAGGAAYFLSRKRLGRAAMARFVSDAKKALLGPIAFVVQLTLSVALIFCHFGVFYCVARATGLGLEIVETVQIVPLVLGATSLPLAFAGWGAREATIAALYGFLGLSPAAGVSVGVIAGALYLVASSPALLVLLLSNPGPDIPRAEASPRIATRDLAKSLWFGGGAIISAITGDVTFFIATGLIAFGIQIVWPRGKWTPSGRFGIANTITVARIFVIAGFGHAFDAFSRPLFFGLVILIWIIDGLDGWIARKTNSASEFGARLDSETDAYYIMILSLLLMINDIVGPWVLIAGLWRFFYAGLIAVIPSRGEVPRSRFARSVFGLLTWSLAATFIAPFPLLATALAATGTILVSISFSSSMSWSLRGRGFFMD